MLVSYSRWSHLVAGVKSCLIEINARAVIRDNTVNKLCTSNTQLVVVVYA